MSTAEVATFRLAGLLTGLDVNRVQEVLGPQDVMVVPRAPAGVAGILNLRGRVLAVVDVRSRLGLPARPGDGRTVHAVVTSTGRLDSLLFDAVGDVVTLDTDAAEPPPETVPESIRRCTVAAYPQSDGLLLLLDIDLLIDEEGGPTGAGARD